LRRYKYVLNLDVRQFFQSVVHQILLSILSRSIADQRAINLIRKIIASGNGIQADEYDMVYFPDDNIFSASRPRGLPIGNLTSQNWANVYLNELDQYAKRVLKCRAYIRYVDDMVLFSDEKEQMNQWRADIIQYAQTLRLTLHEESSQSRPSHTGVSFLGFQVFPDHRRLKPANGYAFQRRLKNMRPLYQGGEISQQDLTISVQSWINHVRYGDTWGLRRAILSAAGVYGE
jgi:retron-type reverse transcriptase